MAAEPQAERQRAIDRGSTGRIEALSDGIYAIAMTLLIISLHAPDGSRNAAAALRHQGGPLLAFVISFVVLAVFWFGHRQQFERLTHADHSITWLCLLQLGLVCLTPFTASLLGRFLTSRLAGLVYGTDLTAIGLLHWLIWCYATGRGQLIDRELPKDYLAHSRRLSAIPAAGYALATLTAVIYPWIAIGLFALNPLPFVTGTYYRALTRRRQNAITGKHTLARERASPSPRAR